MIKKISKFNYGNDPYSQSKLEFAPQVLGATNVNDSHSLDLIARKAQKYHLQNKRLHQNSQFAHGNTPLMQKDFIPIKSKKASLLHKQKLQDTREAEIT